MAEPEFTPEELASEEWRDVVGYEGIYSVSSLGRIRRDLGSPGTRAGKILRPSSNNKGGHGIGYLTVMLRKEGKSRRFLVHGLVARAFLGPRPDGHSVNHIDASDPATMTWNNRAKNLEYRTPQGQMDHAKANNLTPSGDRNGSRTHPESRQRGAAHYTHQRPETIRKGSKHPRAMLNETEVYEIRRLALTHTATEVANIVHRRFATVYAVIKRLNWRHL